MKQKSEARQWIEVIACMLAIGVAFGIGIGIAATVAQVVPRLLLGGAP